MELSEDGAPASAQEGNHARATEIFARLNAGDERAFGELFALVRGELGALAGNMRNKWSPQPSLRTTELISEAYLRLFGRRLPEIRSRRHFFALVAKTMRSIIIDRYRRRKKLVDIDEVEEPAAGEEIAPTDLLALDAALDRLAQVSPEMAQVVELKFFMGLQMEDIAAVMAVSVETVYRRWRDAKPWLRRELGGDTEGGKTSGRGGAR